MGVVMADLNDGATHRSDGGIRYISGGQAFQPPIVSCDLATLKI